MKKSIVLGLVALSLVACGTKEEVAPAAPAAEVAAPAEAPAAPAADAAPAAEAPAEAAK